MRHDYLFIIISEKLKFLPFLRFLRDEKTQILREIKTRFCGKYIICVIIFSVFPFVSVYSVVEKIEKILQNVGSFEKMR